MIIDRTPAHLRDMPGFVQGLRAIAASHSLDAFRGDRDLATGRLFIDPGEAAQRVPENERARMATLPRRQNIGLRNILAHGYQRIDQETLYRTASGELAAVEHELAASLAARGHR